MKTSQHDWILYQLENKGYISRNQCLRKYISRLGARICDIKKEGHAIYGRYEKTKNGIDFVYYLLK